MPPSYYTLNGYRFETSIVQVLIARFVSGLRLPFQSYHSITAKTSISAAPKFVAPSRKLLICSPFRKKN